MKEVLSIRKPILSEIIQLARYFGNDLPRSLTVIPVFESFLVEAEIKGFFYTTLLWKDMFANILPEGAGRVLVELEDGCGLQATYYVEGPNSTFASFATLDQEKVNGMVVSDALTAFEVESTSVQCPQQISVYPTEAFASDYLTNQPVYYTIAVVAVFIFTASLFMGYDLLVNRRQNAVMTSATRTNKLVSSLFPEGVQERLLEEVSSSSEENQNNSSFKRIKVLSKAESKKGKPIADLFLDTSILFADICGFTAWSSTREVGLPAWYSECLLICRFLTKLSAFSNLYLARDGVPIVRSDRFEAVYFQG